MEPTRGHVEVWVLHNVRSVISASIDNRNLSSSYILFCYTIPKLPISGIRRQAALWLLLVVRKESITRHAWRFSENFSYCSFF